MILNLAVETPTAAPRLGDLHGRAGLVIDAEC
jgi:hypothetical protein